jgi:hypothetical protein
MWGHNREGFYLFPAIPADVVSAPSNTTLPSTERAIERLRDHRETTALTVVM